MLIWGPGGTHSYAAGVVGRSSVVCKFAKVVSASRADAVICCAALPNAAQLFQQDMGELL